MRRFSYSALFTVLALTITNGSILQAADHGDAPIISNNRAADIGDVYVFLDPNDNDRLVLSMTTQGFIVPGEAVNFSVFDPTLIYRFELETTGNAGADHFIDIRFTRKVESGATPQIATVRLPDGSYFKAHTTVSNLGPMSPDPVVTNDGPSGVSFFAGEVDDPFFFDVPGFSGFVGSVLSGGGDPSQLQRGRDTFAGYNTLAIALSMPVSLLGEPRDNIVGVDAVTKHRKFFKRRNRDRAGLPAVNTALIPFPRKDEYNRVSTRADARGRFADDIVATLQALGTNDDNIDLLAQLAVVRGDFLRIDLGIPNTGDGGGDNPDAGFPNGRRLADDVIDTILSIVTNGAINDGDNVDGNELPFRNGFPFYAMTHQPFDPGTTDDRTRN